MVKAKPGGTYNRHHIYAGFAFYTITRPGNKRWQKRLLGPFNQEAWPDNPVRGLCLQYCLDDRPYPQG